jgi:hypothetical protein
MKNILFFLETYMKTNFYTFELDIIFIEILYVKCLVYFQNRDTCDTK